MKLAVGIGCDRGVALATVEQGLRQALKLANADNATIALLASIDRKQDEVAFVQLGKRLGVNWQFFSAEKLAQVNVPNPSATVLRYMGTPAVAEAAALLAANATLEALLVEKYKFRGDDGKHVTVSLVRMSA